MGKDKVYFILRQYAVQPQRKTYQNIDKSFLNWLEYRKLNFTTFSNTSDLQSIFTKYRFDVIFSLHYPERYRARKNVDYQLWCLIQHTFDTFVDHHILDSGVEQPDFIFLWGTRWFESAYDFYLKVHGRRLTDVWGDKKVHYVGSTKLDLYRMINPKILIDDKTCLFIPPDTKKGPFYFPSIRQFTKINSIFKIISYEKYLNDIIHFMGDSPLISQRKVIVKTRMKSYNARRILALGDIIYDFYESSTPTIIDLLLSSDLVINFQSTVGMESLALRKRTININYLSNVLVTRAELVSFMYTRFLDDCANDNFLLNIQSNAQLKTCSNLLEDWYYVPDSNDLRIQKWFKSTNSSGEEISKIVFE